MASKGEDIAIVFRRLDGVQVVEDKLLLNGGFETPEVGIAADRVMKKYFGVTYLEAVKANGGMRYVFDDERDDVLLELFDDIGIDMRDDNGRLLRCARIVASTIVIVAEGVAGHMPSIADAKDINWGADLAKQAEEFARKRGR